MASHSQVAHRWAQDDPNARTVSGLHMRCERRRNFLPLFAPDTDVQTLFSYGYHFPIAAFVTTPAGERVVLFTAQDFSVSTSRHKSMVRSAISGVPVFVVQHVDPLHVRGSLVDFHSANLTGLVRSAAEWWGKAQRTRKNAAWYAERAQAQLDMAVRYAAAFGLSWSPPELERLGADLAEREKAEQARYAAERAARAKEEAERVAQLRASQLDDFIGWTNGVWPACPSAWRTDLDGNAYMRRHRGAFDALQTSQGFTVPWSEAVKVFHFVHSRRSAATPWTRRADTAMVRVGHFQVDHVNADGSFHAGCHAFAWAEIERLAKKEGILS